MPKEHMCYFEEHGLLEHTIIVGQWRRMLSVATDYTGADITVLGIDRVNCTDGWTVVVYSDGTEFRLHNVCVIPLGYDLFEECE